MIKSILIRIVCILFFLSYMFIILLVRNTWPTEFMKFFKMIEMTTTIPPKVGIPLLGIIYGLVGIILEEKIKNALSRHFKIE